IRDQSETRELRAEAPGRIGFEVPTAVDSRKTGTGYLRHENRYRNFAAGEGTARGCPALKRPNKTKTRKGRQIVQPALRLYSILFLVALRRQRAVQSAVCKEGVPRSDCLFPNSGRCRCTGRRIPAEKVLPSRRRDRQSDIRARR